MNNNDLSLSRNNGEAACGAARGQGLASHAVFGQGAFTSRAYDEGCPDSFVCTSAARTRREVKAEDLRTPPTLV